MLMKHIERKRYLDRLMNVHGTLDIEIITEVCQCGKTYTAQRGRRAAAALKFGWVNAVPCG